jgi:hypothetical protein
LVKRGFLCESAEGKSACTIHVPPAEHDFYDDSTFSRIRVRQCLAAFRAYHRARRALPSMEKTINRVKQIKRQAKALRRPPVSSLRDHMHSFARLRRLLYDVDRQCLPDSITALEYLADFEIFPHFIIGVRTDTFESHNWLQVDALVLNDRALNVRYYSPILVL